MRTNFTSFVKFYTCWLISYTQRCIHGFLPPGSIEAANDALRHFFPHSLGRFQLLGSCAASPHGDPGQQFLLYMQVDMTNSGILCNDNIIQSCPQCCFQAKRLDASSICLVGIGSQSSGAKFAEMLELPADVKIYTDARLDQLGRCAHLSLQG